MPLQGPLGIIGPAAELCAQLAVDEINADSGVVGRELRLHTVDGGQLPYAVADEVRGLVARGAVHAVAGSHTSAVREVLGPAVTGRIPYVYTSLYEGGERAPGVFVTGETPGSQLLPAMRLLAQERRVRSWFLVGNDYVWPRRTAEVVRRFVRAHGGTVAGESYVPLGTADFSAVLAKIQRSGADAVLPLLVGQDGVHFHRQFARVGLHSEFLRLSPLLEESMLMAAGPDATHDLFAAAGYFSTLTTADSLEFGGRYARRFGPDAPTPGTLAESCYEGIRLFAALVEHAGTAQLPELETVADHVTYEGARGALRLREHHVAQRIFFAEASGMEFNVLAELTPEPTLTP